MNCLKTILTHPQNSDIIPVLLGAWCSGLARRPVKPEVAGSNPVAPVKPIVMHYHTKDPDELGVFFVFHCFYSYPIVYMCE